MYVMCVRTEIVWLKHAYVYKYVTMYSIYCSHIYYACTYFAYVYICMVTTLRSPFSWCLPFTE